ncbi:MAG: hypothetical protein AAF363_20505 [Bacteroidota bacterium]
MASLLNYSAVKVNISNSHQSITTMDTLLIDRIPKHEYDQAIRLYADHCYSGKDVSEVLKNSTEALYDFMDSISEEKINNKYRADKWSSVKWSSTSYFTRSFLKTESG